MGKIFKILIALILAIFIYSGSSIAQITSSASGNWSSVATWTGNVVPGPADNVTITAGHTVTLDVDSAQCKDLIIEGSNATLRFAIDGSVSGITINGNLLINSGGRLRVESRNPAGAANSFVEHKLYIFGNLTNNGTVDLRGGSTSGGTSNGVLTTFVGSSNSTISLINTDYKSSGEEFNGITIDKTNGGKVILSSGNLFMVNQSTVGPCILTFNEGIIETQGTSIWVFLPTNSAGIVGASTSCFVSGTLGRGMSNSGGTEKTFEIGDEDGYRPVTVRTTTSGAASGHYIYAKIIKGNANTGSSNLTGGIDSVSSKRYFEIGYSTGGITSAAASMSIEEFTPTYKEDDDVAKVSVGLVVAYSTDGRATWVNCGPTNHVTDLSIPPTPIQSSKIDPALILNNGNNLNVSLAFSQSSITGPVPDIANESYGPNPLNKFDFWKANSTTPAPLLVYIHGGGLTSGSKVDISLNLVSALLAKGISVMSINYRLSPEVVVPQHYMDCARAIQYARYHASELNIDPDHIAAGGSSAGALTSFWLGYHDDLADAGNSDPILQQSTRLSALVCWSGQTTLEKDSAAAWVGPYVLEFSSYFKGTIFGIAADSMNTQTAKNLMTLGSPYNYVTSNDPPTWMYYSLTDTPTNSSEAIHNVNFGVHLQYALGSKGVVSSLLTPSYTSSITDTSVNFLAYYLLPSATGLKDDGTLINNYKLDQNYPNPFNPATLINFSIPKSGFVTLKIYDLLGREVAELINKQMDAGNHKINFDASYLSSGVYIYTIKAGSFVSSKKMVLLK